MKFRSERDALVDMLTTASRAVGGRGGSSPVLLGLLLSCEGNALRVTGTDLPALNRALTAHGKAAIKPPAAVPRPPKC